MRPCLIGNQLWTAGFRAPRSTTCIGFWSPPAFLPLSGGGGGPESGVHLFNGRDHDARINGVRGDSGPPRLSIFKRGGGGPESGVHLSDGQDRRARINDARTVSSFSAALLLASVGPFPSMWYLPPSHRPLTVCHVSRSFPRQPPAKSKPIISRPLLPPPVSFCHVSSSVVPLTPRHSLSRPHGFGAITPVIRPILRTGLPAYPPGHSADPGGSTKGRPRPKGTELAGPFSIPMKQLLKQLVVVSHRLRHNGKVRRRIKGTSIHPLNCQELDCVCHSCTIIQRLQLQVVRGHADAKFLMQRLSFVVVVVLSICRRFRHFCIYRW
jgi:hypothetical protein